MSGNPFSGLANPQQNDGSNPGPLRSSRTRLSGQMTMMADQNAQNTQYPRARINSLLENRVMGEPQLSSGAGSGGHVAIKRTDSYA